MSRGTQYSSIVTCKLEPLRARRSSAASSASSPSSSSTWVTAAGAERLRIDGTCGELIRDFFVTLVAFSFWAASAACLSLAMRFCRASGKALCLAGTGPLVGLFGIVLVRTVVVVTTFDDP